MMTNVVAKKMGLKVVFRKGVHFSRAGLAEHLNEKYGKKKSGKLFTSRDIQQYAKRGCLPTQYGGHPIKEIKYIELGVFVEVKFNK